MVESGASVYQDAVEKQTKKKKAKQLISWKF